MKSGATLNLLWLTLPVAVQAHPGHPAVTAEHSHAFLGMDPAYALVLSIVGIAGGVLFARRRRRARSKAE